MTYEELYHRGRERLAAAGIAEAGLDARLLLEYVCGTDRNALLVHGDRPVENGNQAAYEELISGREKRIPLQHLTGTQEFMGLEFQVNEAVLIPRQDTEILVEEVLRNLHDGMRILDMCTGSGCILISLLHYTNDCEGVGLDISEAALAVAEKNAAKLLGGKMQERHGKIRFVQSDLFQKAEGKFDIITCNPPYISRAELDTLMPEVGRYEPAEALYGGEDGLFFYRKIVEESRKHLYGGGMLFFEIGWQQAGEVCRLMERAGFEAVAVVKDYAGLDRVVYGSRGFE
ncbi:MAG: peptide chain release factor N(5)-glutamine methyltransferase [Lachnospiraceae bacterium]|nr:peptide chain release factor N(5)-glutamine methyltransferase [Lachnospiraceae bacterium]